MFSPTQASLLLATWVVLAAAGPAQEPAVVEADSPAGLLDGPKPPAIVPPTAEAIEASLRRGVDWLLANQNQDGSWGGPHRTKSLNIYAPVPGAHHAFGTATTALALVGMMDSRDDRPEVESAIERAEKWLLLKLPTLRRAVPRAIYNDWGHSFGLQALVRMLDRKPDDEARRQEISAQIAEQVELLSRYEVVDGGWAYYDFNFGTKKPGGASSSFTTATALIALREAELAGVPVPPVTVDRAVAALTRMRSPDFTYLYGESHKHRPRAGINRPGGSLGRSQACNAALRMWGDSAVTDEVLHTWLDRLFARNGWLSIGRKRPVPHESWMAVAGYFYYYGHYYAGYCIDLLPEGERQRHRDQLAHVLIGHQEKDGSWFDYPLYDYGHPYGTGFVLSTLARCRAPAK